MVNTNNPANPDTGKNSLIALNNKKNIDTIHGLSAWRKASINFQNRVDDILSNTKMAWFKKILDEQITKNLQEIQEAEQKIVNASTGKVAMGVLQKQSIEQYLKNVNIRQEELKKKKELIEQIEKEAERLNKLVTDAKIAQEKVDENWARIVFMRWAINKKKSEESITLDGLTDADKKELGKYIDVTGNLSDDNEQILVKMLEEELETRKILMQTKKLAEQDVKSLVDKLDTLIKSLDFQEELDNFIGSIDLEYDDTESQDKEDKNEDSSVEKILGYDPSALLADLSPKPDKGTDNRTPEAEETDDFPDRDIIIIPQNNDWKTFPEAESTNPDNTEGTPESDEIPETPEDSEKTDFEKWKDLHKDKTPEELAKLIQEEWMPGTLNATFIDMKPYLEDIARKNAEEKMRKEYKKSGFFKKIGMWFTRKKKTNDLFEKEFDKVLVDSEEDFRNDVAQTFENMLKSTDSTKFQKIDLRGMTGGINQMATDIFREYLNWQLSKQDLQIKVTGFLEMVTPEGVNVRTIGNNLLGKMELYADLHRGLQQDLEYLNTVWNISWGGILRPIRYTPSSNDNLPWEYKIDQELRAKNMKALLSLMAKDFSEKDMEAWIKKDKDFVQALIHKIENSTLDVQFFENFRGASEIDDASKKNSKIYKTGELVQSHPVITSVGTAGTIATLSAIFGPMGNLFAGMTGVGGINASRRYKEITDEHTDTQNRILNNERSEIAALFEPFTDWDGNKTTRFAILQKQAQNMPPVKKLLANYQLDQIEAKYRLYDNRKKDVKKVAILDEKGNPVMKSVIKADGTREMTSETKLEIIDNRTTAHHIVGLDILISGLEKSLNNIQTSKQLRVRLAYVMALLDAWEKFGTSFISNRHKTHKKSENLSSKDTLSIKKIREKDFGKLYSLIERSIRTLRTTPENIKQSTEYQKAMKTLSDDYARAQANFAKTRQEMSMKSGLKSAAIYGVSSTFFQFLTNSGFFAKASVTPETIIPATPNTVTGQKLIVDPAIANDLQKTLWAAWYNELVNSVQNASEKNLWDILQKNIFHNLSVTAEIKNQIMQYILNAQDIQNDISKPELLIEAMKYGLTNDLAQTHGLDHVVSLLHRWGYNDVTADWLRQTITAVNNGTLDVASMPASDQTRLAEALFTYVSNTQSSDALTRVFLDLKDIIQPGTAERIIPGMVIDPSIVASMGAPGVPVANNTFNSPLADAENDKNSR